MQRQFIFAFIATAFLLLGGITKGLSQTTPLNSCNCDCPIYTLDRDSFESDTAFEEAKDKIRGNYTSRQITRYIESISSPDGNLKKAIEELMEVNKIWLTAESTDSGSYVKLSEALDSVIKKYGIRWDFYCS